MEEAVQLHEGVRPLGVGGHGDSAESKIQIQKKYKCKYNNKYKQVMAREYAALSEAEAANLLEEKDQDLVLAAELGNQN